MAVTKQEIADALGVTVERLNDIVGTSGKSAVNEKALFVIDDALTRAQALSDDLLRDSRQQIADLQGKLNQRESVHTEAIAQLRALRVQAEARELDDVPDVESIVVLIT